MIAIADADAFYVACEKVFDPSLEGRPVGILTNNDGAIIARSKEIKALGIAMGTPVFQIPPEQRRQLTLLSSNYALYGSMSQRVSATLAHFTSQILPYSIDESFLSLDGFALNTLEAHCHAMRNRVRKVTGIPVSVGVSTSKTLAKVANKLAKRTASCDGVCLLQPDSSITRRILEQTPVTDLWGVAIRTGARLADMDIHNAWELRNADPKRVRSMFSVVLERTVWELRGRDCIELDEMSAPKKQIMVSRSFGRLTANPQDLHEAIRHHASRAGEKLRKQQSLAHALMVFVKTNPFRTDLPQHSESRLLPLPCPTDDTRLIVGTASSGLRQIYRQGCAYQKVGVMLTDLTDKAYEQQDLLANRSGDADRAKNERLMAVVDKLNREHGAGTVQVGLSRPDAAWHVRCAHRTPRYTTRWDELPTARIG